ncbi:MAG: aspartate aminotransferase family protein [SAR202 cluster bacterium]|nr:aspartate aminotransferase family protein [SAR202 cluster bacterium]
MRKGRRPEVATDWIGIEKKYYAQTVRRQPIVIIRGQGTKVWDANDKEYLDFTAGWAVNQLGHCHPALQEAMREQGALLMQTSNQFYTVPQLQLAQILIDNSCMDRVFFGNSGAEANEGALKLARRWGKKNRNGAFEVITAYNSFHGRTMSTVAATGQPHYQEAFQPLQPGFKHVEFNNVEAIMEATTEKTAAVLLEPIQGEGGVNMPSEDYLKRVREWCDKQNLLLILDEIQTGMGRLGSLYGYQEYGIEPDVITLAKGLGGGLPIGAFMSTEKAFALEYGDHGSTFGGNAFTTAVAYANVKYIIDHKVPSNAKAMGSHLMKRLNELKKRHSFISEVRGRGLLVAVQFDKDMAASALAKCNEAGVLFNMVRPNTLRLMPPLNITASEIDEGVSRFEKALKGL